MKPFISIVIPYYKKKKYIGQTINSIIKQSYKNFELILIYDDPDKSDLNYIKEIVKNIKRKKIIINNNNIGAGLSRNLGILKAKGKYISFIDGDDIWKKDKLKNQLLFMLDNKIEFCFTSYSIINKKNTIIKFIKAKKNIDYKDLIKSCDIGLSTVMLKTRLLKKIKFTKIKTKEDYILWLKLSKKNVKMMGLDQKLVLWRKLDNSLSSSVFQRVHDAFYVYNTYLNFNFIKSIYYIFLMSLNFFRKRYL
ncbi:glycosyltransferase family 2 protein [Candidatus Pelagibacter sp.]|nr:glycosyltransferase family 2 protein [Candidatus Pelagibacter sp.]